MQVPRSNRRRREGNPERHIFSATVDRGVLREIERLQQLGIVANRSAAIETGLQLLLTIHRDRLAQDERQAA